MKKQKHIKLAVPKPCNENWNNMSPNGNGRHCSSCEKTVIDFSKLSDSEIYQVLSENNTKVCGRFSAFQLNRNIYSQVQINHSIYPKVLLAAAIASCSIYPVFSQDNFAEFQTETSQLNAHIEPNKSWPEFGKDSTKFINGRVIDSETGEPIPFTSIFIKEIKREFKCDKDGNFKIEVTENFPDTFVIVSKDPEYFENGLKISKIKIPTFIELKLETKYTLDGTDEFITGKIKIIHEPSPPKDNPKPVKR